MTDPLKAECEGYGCIPADFMFVGISAGRLGALVTKVPFTKDASGRIFQRCLNRLGLSKSDEFSLQPELTNCYVTNLVKSRVLTSKGLNRLPTIREMIDWFPYFQAEVERVKPKKIIVLSSLVENFLRKTDYRSQLIVVKHPRWYQAHGALNPDSKAFAEMIKDYCKGVFGMNNVIDKVKTIGMIMDLPDFCCPFDAEFLGGNPNCEHDFVKQPSHDTWCSWKCSKCQMEVRVGVYE